MKYVIYYIEVIIVRLFKKDEIDEFIKEGKIIINSAIIDGKVYCKLNYSDTVGIGYFIDSNGIQRLIFNHLRGSVCVLDDNYYKVIYPAMDKFFNLHEIEKLYPDITSRIELQTAIEKLDGMMILPFVIDDVVYLSSRWNFDTIPVIVSQQYLTDEYKKFILDCYNNKIYLTFELISYESQIRVLYDPSRYGLYLVSAQDESGRVYPLKKSIDNKYYVQNGKRELEIPNSILHAEVYDISTLNNLENFVSSFRGIEFEGVVAFTTEGQIFKLKNINYIMTSNSKRLFIDNFVDIIVDNRVDDAPDIILNNPAFIKINELWGKFNDEIQRLSILVTEFSSKKEIGLYVQHNNLTGLYKILFNLFDGNFDIDRKRKMFKTYVKDNFGEE